MADNEQEQLLVAAAEPEDCSRRAMASVLGCAGVALLCLFGFLVPVMRHILNDKNYMPQLPVVSGAGFAIVTLLSFGLGSATAAFSSK